MRALQFQRDSPGHNNQRIVLYGLFYFMQKTIVSDRSCMQIIRIQKNYAIKIHNHTLTGAEMSDNIIIWDLFDVA